MKSPITLKLTDRFTNKILGLITVYDKRLEEILRNNLKEHQTKKQNDLCSKIVLRPSAFLEEENISVLSNIGVFIE